MSYVPSIPGLAGNTSFKTSADAEKIAKLVLKELKFGLMPPAVSTKELDELQKKS